MPSAEIKDWKALVICPKRELLEKLAPLLGSYPGLRFTALADYPLSISVGDLIAKDAYNLCFLEVGTNQETALPLVSQLSGSGVVVVAVHTDTDPGLILRCLRRGAGEFLVAPVDEHQLAKRWSGSTERRTLAAEFANWDRFIHLPAARAPAEAPRLQPTWR